ncbi:MAG: hypothetical protein P4N41_19045 [Negativicutes bacterium]|nr:hypothetical protein [Negativicutes bacterium]MDR3591756.1 hypothetical protein [Negativicutes bacterium]
MTWLLILLLVGIAVFFYLKKKPAQEALPQLAVSGSGEAAAGLEGDELQAVLAAAIAEYESADISQDELLAIIAAAVAEHEGGDFRVVRIRPSGRSWAFTGRQELMHSRL